MKRDIGSLGQVRGIVPHITIRGGQASSAIGFYEKAFGAQEVLRTLTSDGLLIVAAQLRINGGLMTVSDEFKDGINAIPPGSAFPRNIGLTFHLQVDDADACWEQALAAGAEIYFPLREQYWGDRYGQLCDPFGFIWAIGSRITKH